MSVDKHESIPEEEALEMLRGLRVEDLSDYDLSGGLARFEQTQTGGVGQTAGSKAGLWASVGVVTAVAGGLLALALSARGGNGESTPSVAPPPAPVSAPVAETIEPPTPVPPPAPVVAPELQPASPAPGTIEEEAPPSAKSRTRPKQRTQTKQPADSGRSETELAAQMRRSLESDPARALELAEEGERRFPNGMFNRERQGHVILALAALGRMDEARGRGKAYLQRYPRGAQSERIRAAIAD